MSANKPPRENHAISSAPGASSANPTPSTTPSRKKGASRSPARRSPTSRSPSKLLAQPRASSRCGSTARSPSAKHRSPSKSPAKENDLVELTINCIMEGVEEAKLLASTSCKVRDLKINVSEITDVLPEKMLLLYKNVELKNDNLPISSYGINDDCELIMSVKMNTGSKTARPSNAVLYVPPSFPEGSVNELRNKIKTMTTIRQRAAARAPRLFRKARTPIDKNHTEWTPQKQMEHEITRNKMKKLLKKKRKRILSDESPPRSLGSVESRSVIMGTPEEMMSEEDLKEKHTRACRTFITPVELRTFFEPPETILEMEQRSKYLSLPPSNMKELQAAREKREALLKTVCKVCYTKLKPTEQQLNCACGYVFCKTHRRPENHLCHIDHKQSGRLKIHKENPKVSDGGMRKLKL